FSKDAWSTAATLLSWRDTLVAGGWARGPIDTPRVDDLAAAETCGPVLPLGLIDRAVALEAALPDRPGLRLSKLYLLEPKDALPPAWRRLIDKLMGAGVAVREHVGRSAAQIGTDLCRVQKALGGELPDALVGDGSFVMVEADTTLMAAEVLADWLA